MLGLFFLVSLSIFYFVLSCSHSNWLGKYMTERKNFLLVFFYYYSHSHPYLPLSTEKTEYLVLYFSSYISIFISIFMFNSSSFFLQFWVMNFLNLARETKSAWASVFRPESGISGSFNHKTDQESSEFFPVLMSQVFSFLFLKR